MRFLTLSIVLLFFSCKEQAHKEQRDIELQYLNVMMNIQGEDTTFSHYLYVKNIESPYVSLDVIISSYLDTISHDLPISSIKLYSSDKGFVIDQASQDWEKIDKNHLISILLRNDSSEVRVRGVSINHFQSTNMEFNLESFNRRVNSKKQRE